MKQPKKGFTFIELLVVIAIISVLAALLLPAMSRAREKGRRAVCVSNLRQIGLATQQYVGENQGWLPCGYWTSPWSGEPSLTSANILVGGYPHNIGMLMHMGYLPERPGVEFCPSRPSGTRFAVDAQVMGWSGYRVGDATATSEGSYSYRGTRQIDTSSSICLAADVFFWENPAAWETGGPKFLGASACHKGDYYNTLFSDGSVRFFVDSGGYFATMTHFDQEPGLDLFTTLLQ